MMGILVKPVVYPRAVLPSETPSLMAVSGIGGMKLLGSTACPFGSRGLGFTWRWKMKLVSAITVNPVVNAV